MRRRPSSSPTAAASGLAPPMHSEEKQPQQPPPRTYPIILDTMKNDRPLPPAQPPPAVPPTAPSDAMLSPAVPVPAGGKGSGDKPMIIQPPLPPQHVHAPMPALGALSIGFLNKKKEKKEDADFRLITNGNVWLGLKTLEHSFTVYLVVIGWRNVFNWHFQGVSLTHSFLLPLFQLIPRVRGSVLCS